MTAIERLFTLPTERKPARRDAVAEALRAARQESDWADTSWGWYDASRALRDGLQVTEHEVPAGFAQALSGPA